MERWDSFLYLYIVGGIFFWGAVLLGIRHKVLELNKPGDRRVLYAMGVTYFGYLIFQGIWQIWALRGVA